MIQLDSQPILFDTVIRKTKSAIIDVNPAEFLEIGSGVVNAYTAWLFTIEFINPNFEVAAINFLSSLKEQLLDKYHRP